jgi:hypothetical protein
MRGVLLFLVLITIVMLGLAGCPKPSGEAGGGGEVKTVGEPAGGDAAGDGGAGEGGE